MPDFVYYLPYILLKALSDGKKPNILIMGGIIIVLGKIFIETPNTEFDFARISENILTEKLLSI